MSERRIRRWGCGPDSVAALLCQITARRENLPVTGNSRTPHRKPKDPSFHALLDPADAHFTLEQGGCREHASCSARRRGPAGNRYADRGDGVSRARHWPAIPAISRTMPGFSHSLRIIYICTPALSVHAWRISHRLTPVRPGLAAGPGPLPGPGVRRQGDSVWRCLPRLRAPGRGEAGRCRAGHPGSQGAGDTEEREGVGCGMR